jgi:hypothetical protein
MGTHPVEVEVNDKLVKAVVNHHAFDNATKEAARKARITSGAPTHARMR